jgi:pimeloyl-ACP methyl ester carboxylesterase
VRSPSDTQILTWEDQGTAYYAAYREVGQGAPLLFLHGFMGDGACWQALMTELSSHYRCISLDQLGFGASSKPKMRYDLAKLSAFVHQVITRLDLAPVTLIGHSLGGWVSATYALNHPEQVSSLVLLAPAGIRDDSFCGRYDHLRPLLWQTPLVDLALGVVTPLAHWAGQGDALKQIKWMRRELNAQPAARSFLVDRLRPEDAIDTVENDIYRVETPTLVITGDRDETIPLWHSETYAQRIAKARLEIIPNADHALPTQYTTEVADRILPFLRQSVSTMSPSTQNAS